MDEIREKIYGLVDLIVDGLKNDEVSLQEAKENAKECGQLLKTAIIDRFKNSEETDDTAGEESI